MILALDCATSEGSIALVEGTRVVRESAFETPRGRGGALFGAVEEFLGEDLNILKVVAGTGPGSYNGIRTALATGWGIARARGLPFLGISSLLALDSGDYLAVGDARRGQFYFARVSEGAFAEAPALYSGEEVLEKIEAVGEINGGSLPLYVPEELEILPGALVCRPQAVRLADLARTRSPDEGMPEPMYLKSAFITKAKGSVESEG